jgi:hypothetical protein
MTPESRNSSLKGNGSVNTFLWKKTRNNRKAVICVVHAAFAAAQRRSKHISTAVNQRATIEEAVFSVVVALRL